MDEPMKAQDVLGVVFGIVGIVFTFIAVYSNSDKSILLFLFSAVNIVASRACFLEADVERIKERIR